MVWKKGKFYLLATCEVPEEEPKPFVNGIGVNLGMVNTATTSEGHTYSAAAARVKRLSRLGSGIPIENKFFNRWAPSQPNEG